MAENSSNPPAPSTVPEETRFNTAVQIQEKQLDVVSWNGTYCNMLAGTKAVIETMLETAKTSGGCSPAEMRALLQGIKELDAQVRRLNILSLGEKPRDVKRSVHVNINTNLEELEKKGINPKDIEVKSAQFFASAEAESDDD